MAADALLDIYIDAQIVLALAALIWGIARVALHRLAPGSAFSLHLQMLYCVLTAALLAPVALLAMGFAREIGWLGAGSATTLTDVALAQYLSGRFEMAPSTVEWALLARQQLLIDVTTLATPTAQWIAALLIGGTLLMAVRLVLNGWRVMSIVRGSYLLRRIGRTDIRVTDRAVIPFSTRGLARNHIVMPSTLLAEARDMRIAVTHEIQHVRQHDLIWELLFEVGRPIFFWNPAFHLLKRNVETLRELSCDERVLGRGTLGVRDYCECLLRVCRDALGGAAARRVLLPTVPFASVAGGSGARVLRLRVTAMLERVAAQPGLLLRAVIVLPMLAMIVLGAGLSQRSGDWSHDRLMLSTIVNLERMEMRTSMAGSAAFGQR